MTKKEIWERSKMYIPKQKCICCNKKDKWFILPMKYGDSYILICEKCFLEKGEKYGK